MPMASHTLNSEVVSLMDRGKLGRAKIASTVNVQPEWQRMGTPFPGFLRLIRRPPRS